MIPTAWVLYTLVMGAFEPVRGTPTFDNLPQCEAAAQEMTKAGAIGVACWPETHRD